MVAATAIILGLAAFCVFMVVMVAGMALAQHLEERRFLRTMGRLGFEAGLAEPENKTLRELLEAEQ